MDRGVQSTTELPLPRINMRKIRLARLVAVACLITTPAAAQTPATKIASAANAFLATLDAAQRQRVLFAFDDEKQRAHWSNFPNQMVRRSGLSLGELSPAQRSAAMAVVSSALSKKGFEKIQQIMDADEALKANERNNPMFGKDLYFISFLGTPSEKTPWMLQFGGHHLAVNVTIAGDHGVLTPTLTGAQPALYTANGKTIRPLGGENDKAFALLNSLNDQQRKQAILTYRVADLVLGPGQDNKKIQPEGLKASEMTEQQRTTLLDLVAEWSGIVHETAAEARMSEIKAGINDTWFAWSGPTTVEPGRNGTAYYRIQGPNLVIEYAPQAMGGDPSMHIHTMYRDPTNDYGRRVIAK